MSDLHQTPKKSNNTHWLGLLFIFLGSLIFSLTLIFQAIVAFGNQEARVIQIQRHLRMSKEDPIYKDYIINSGQDDGLRAGIVLPVVRRHIVQDPFQSKTDESLRLPVAKIKLLAVYKNTSIGRVLSHQDPKEGGVLEFRSIMVGDAVDISAKDTIFNSVSTEKQPVFTIKEGPDMDEKDTSAAISDEEEQDANRLPADTAAPQDLMQFPEDPDSNYFLQPIQNQKEGLSRKPNAEDTALSIISDSSLEPSFNEIQQILNELSATEEAVPSSSPGTSSTNLTSPGIPMSPLTE